MDTSLAITYFDVTRRGFVIIIRQSSSSRPITKIPVCSPRVIEIGYVSGVYSEFAIMPREENPTRKIGFIVGRINENN